ncbi:hypothetical protein OQA88_2089 [Cercophora sp. LCS_1]
MIERRAQEQNANTNAEASGSAAEAPGASESVEPTPALLEPPELTPEQEALRLSKRYVKPEETPPLFFLQKAWHKIAQPRAGLLPSDQPFDHTQPFKLPDRHRWDELLEEYLSSWYCTYNFVHRPSLKQWMEVLYTNYTTDQSLTQDISPAKTAVVLMALAIGSFFRDRAHRDKKGNRPDAWIWTTNFGDNLYATAVALSDSEKGTLTLESAQARLLQDFYLLSTSRLNQGWCTFGRTAQVITLLGLHRKMGRNRGLSVDATRKPNYPKIQCERRLFWSAYVIDRQLSMLFGRPAHFTPDQVDQELPDHVNDEDADEAGPIRAHPTDCYSSALIYQAQLAQLLDRIFRDVYTIQDVPEVVRVEAAKRYVVELEEWKESLPRLLSHQRVTDLLPLFRRQATLLKLTHCHAQMLLLRLFITASYPPPQPKVKVHPYDDAYIRDCSNAARACLGLLQDFWRFMEPRMFGTMWYTHYVAYISGAVIYTIPHIRDRQRLFGGLKYRGWGKTDQDRLEFTGKILGMLGDGTPPYSPGRRYVIILRELKAEMERQVPPQTEEQATGTQTQRTAEDQDSSNSDSDDSDDEEQDGSAVQENSRADGQYEEEHDSPNEQLLVDALRTHWEAEIPQVPVARMEATPAPIPAQQHEEEPPTEDLREEHERGTSGEESASRARSAPGVGGSNSSDSSSSSSRPVSAPGAGASTTTNCRHLPVLNTNSSGTCQTLRARDLGHSRLLLEEIHRGAWASNPLKHTQKTSQSHRKDSYKDNRKETIQFHRKSNHTQYI